jgi:hypothetical protein
VGLGTALDDVERRKILPLSGVEIRPVGRPARNQSLYRLSYPGSAHKKVLYDSLAIISLNNINRLGFVAET